MDQKGEPISSDLKRLPLLDPLADYVGTLAICVQSHRPFSIHLPLCDVKPAVGSVVGPRVMGDGIVPAHGTWWMENYWLEVHGVSSAVTALPGEESCHHLMALWALGAFLQLLRHFLGPEMITCGGGLSSLGLSAFFPTELRTANSHRSSQEVWHKNLVFVNICKVLVQSTDRNWGFFSWNI